jgi:hypothetical protein
MSAIDAKRTLRSVCECAFLLANYEDSSSDTQSSSGRVTGSVANSQEGGPAPVGLGPHGAVVFPGFLRAKAPVAAAPINAGQLSAFGNLASWN